MTITNKRVVLGIETSCDETAVAVVTSDREILSHEIVSQLDHNEYGGVVPEIAARAHIHHLPNLIKKSLEKSSLKFQDLSAIAATCGPGLIGGLIVGMVISKAISSAAKLPFIAVNHLEAHALVVRLSNEVNFPFLLLIISGGHCQFLIAHDVGRYSKLGASLDDSLGEAFDKIGKMLGLGYPAGPIIEQRAKSGNQEAFFIPRALKNRAGCDFSFSGIKTHVRNIILKEKINEQLICDISASFQKCVAEILVNRISNAINIAKKMDNTINNFVITGGVAANLYLRNKMTQCIEENNMDVFYPPPKLCTDNGIMVAWTGIERLHKGYIDSLDFNPKARWPLENLWIN